MKSASVGRLCASSVLFVEGLRGLWLNSPPRSTLRRGILKPSLARPGLNPGKPMGSSNRRSQKARDAPGAPPWLWRGEKLCWDGGTHTESQAGTSQRAYPAGSAVSSGGGGKIPALRIRGLPSRQHPAGRAGTRGTRGKEPGFPCPAGASPRFAGSPRPLPHPGILRHTRAGAEKWLCTPQKNLGIKAHRNPPTGGHTRVTGR